MSHSLKNRAALTVSPSALVLLAAFLLFSRSFTLPAALLSAALCHELSHVLTLRLLGAPPRRLTLSATGAELYVPALDRLSYTGELLAVAAGRLRVLEILLWPYVTVIKSVPVASFIIICLIWLNTSQLAVFISFLMVFPAIYSNTLQGIRSADPALLEMARLYRVPFSRRLGYIYVPQVKPFLLSGCSVALGMSWKSGVAAEVIAVTSHSIGGMLYDAKVYLEISDLFAWTLIIVILSLCFEKAFLWLLDRVFFLVQGSL